MKKSPVIVSNDLPSGNGQSGEGKLIIEPGSYEAQCIRYNKFKQYKGEEKLCLEWDFSLSGKEGLVLPQFFSIKYKKFKRSTKYYRCWVIANNGVKPSRPSLMYMTPKKFLNTVAIVTVVYSNPKFPDGEKMPEFLREPTVSWIKELVLPGGLR